MPILDKTSFVPCWRLMKCPPQNRDACVAYREQLSPCWEVPFKKRCLLSEQTNDCKECPVYRMHFDHTAKHDFELPQPTGSVLIVDDEMLIRWALCQSLQRRGYHATAAPSGQEAREQIKKRKFDFILIDVKLPGLDGFTIAEEFHRLSPESQVVLMTACDSDELVERAARLGFSCVQKPFNIEHLSEILGS